MSIPLFPYLIQILLHQMLKTQSQTIPIICTHKQHVESTNTTDCTPVHLHMIEYGLIKKPLFLHLLFNNIECHSTMHIIKVILYTVSFSQGKKSCHHWVHHLFSCDHQASIRYTQSNEENILISIIHNFVPTWLDTDFPYLKLAEPLKQSP